MEGVRVFEQAEWEAAGCTAVEVGSPSYLAKKSQLQIKSPLASSFSQSALHVVSAPMR